MCDTGYFSVAETMPAKPTDLVYDGFVEVFEEFERVDIVKQDTNNAASDDTIIGMAPWLFALIIAGILIIIVATLVFLFRKRCRKTRATPKHPQNTTELKNTNMALDPSKYVGNEDDVFDLNTS